MASPSTPARLIKSESPLTPGAPLKSAAHTAITPLKAAAPAPEMDFRAKRRAAAAKRRAEGREPKRMTKAQVRATLAAENAMREEWRRTAPKMPWADGPQWTPLTPEQQERRRQEMWEWKCMHT